MIVSSRTTFSLAIGQSVIFKIGGSGTATVFVGSLPGQSYVVGQQEAFIGPFTASASVVVDVSNGSIEYVIDGDGDMRDQKPEIAAINARLSVSGASTASGLTAIQALGLARSRRVDFVMMGDSNQAFNGHGFSKYLEKALIERLGLYATGIFAGNGGVFQHVAGRLPATNVTGDGSAFPISDFSLAGAGGNARYGYLAAAATANANTGGHTLSAADGFPTTAALDCWWAYGVDDAFSGGSFNPGVRRNESPWTTIGQVGSISTTAETGFDGLRMSRLSLAADAARTFPLAQHWQIPSANITGPFVSYYTRTEVASANSGVSCHTHISAGGQSAWNFAWYVQNTTDRSLSIYYAEVRRLQIARGLTPIVVFYINTGVNDRNEANTPSLGPARVWGTGDTPAEYVDNLRAIQARIRRIWDINGWDKGELYWLFVPSHRISDPDDAELVAYRAAVASTLALEPQTSMIDLGQMMTFAAANAAGWYDAGGVAHLTTTGYDEVARLMVSQV